MLHCKILHKILGVRVNRKKAKRLNFPLRKQKKKKKLKIKIKI